MLPLCRTPLRACSDPQKHPQGAHQGKTGVGCCWALQGSSGHTAPGQQCFSFTRKSSSAACPCTGLACSAGCSRAGRNQPEGLVPAPKSSFPGPSGTWRTLGALGLAVPREPAGVAVPGARSEGGTTRRAGGRAPTRSGPGTCMHPVQPPRFLPCVCWHSPHPCMQPDVKSLHVTAVSADLQPVLCVLC